MNIFSVGEKQQLIDILDAREQRAYTQSQLIEKHKKPLICYKLNIPGEIKNNCYLQKIFELGLRQIKDFLDTNLVYIHVENKDSGQEAYIIFDADIKSTKLAMCNIEDSTRLGRLYDIDILDENRNPISREDNNLSKRACLICQNMAYDCGRNRTHTLDELKEYINNLYWENASLLTI